MSMRKRKKIQTLLRALIPGRSSRVLPLFLLVLGCAGWVSAATVQSGLRFAAAGGRVVIAGIVTDPLGMPVPQLPVLVSASARPLQADPRLGLKNRKLLVLGVTASDGTFRVVIPVQPGKPKYYLSFFEQGRFDDVRFARPIRIDITRRVNAEKFILYDHQLAFHGAWPNVQETLKAYPKKSPRARVIRRYGIAEEFRKDKDGKKPEVWWYYSKGKRFDFKDGKVVSEKSFTPVFK